MIADATAPSRSTATAVLSWGLINIPVSLYTGTEETRVARSEYIYDAVNGTYQKVGRSSINSVTGEPVERDQIVKMATSNEGELVPLSDEEIAAVTLESDGTAPIVALMPLGEINENYLIEKYYQVRPKAEKKGGQAHERAFGLLTAALRQRGQAAIIRVSIRNSVARFAAITPDGSLLVLHNTDSVRQSRPMPEVDVTDGELEMASKLLDAIGTAVPSMRDENSTRIQEYVDAKAVGGENIEVEAAPTPIGVTSLEDLLAASIAAV